MPRIHANRSSAAPSLDAAGARSTPHLRRSNEQASAPEGLPARRAPGSGALGIPEQLPRARATAALHMLRDAAQNFAQSGAQIARTGGRVGTAVAQAARDNPLLAGGLAGFVYGTAQLTQGLRQNDGTAAAGGAAVTAVAAAVLTASIIRTTTAEIANITGSTVVRPPAPLPMNREVLTEASNMLTGHGSTDMTPFTGRNTLNVLNHLHDIAALDSSELVPQVREAALAARDDPEQLVRSLLALTIAKPPLLSSRRGSSLQPANQPGED